MYLREFCNRNEKNYGGFSEWHYLSHKVRRVLGKITVLLILFSLHYSILVLPLD